MEIRKIMSVPAITCWELDSLNRAAQLMWEHDCGALPVTDGNGSLVGIITDRDVCMAAYTRGRALPELRVADAMTSEVHSSRPEESLEAAEKLMRDNQVRRVPIVDAGNRVAGLLSLTDLARYMASSSDAASLGGDFVKTVAAISRPRTWMLGLSSIQEAAEFSPAPGRAKRQQPRRRRAKAT